MNPQTYQRAYTWTGTGPVVPLASFGPNLPTFAEGSNTAGEVVGRANPYDTCETSVCLNSDGVPVGVYWSADGAIHRVPLLPVQQPHYAMDFDSDAHSINDSHEVVGWSIISLSSGAFANRAYVFSGGMLYELQYQLTGVAVNSVILTDAVSINCQGNILAIGHFAATPATTHNFLLTRQGAARSCP